MMHERMIMDGAGDLWTVEAARPAGAGTTMVRCRHEMGYELMVTLEDAAARDARLLLEALERARRESPRAALAEAA